MKKELTIGAQSAPAYRVSVGKRFRELLNRVLPEECQVKTSQDAWYLGAVLSLILTFIFLPTVILSAYCVIRAKQEGGNNE